MRVPITEVARWYFSRELVSAHPGILPFALQRFFQGRRLRLTVAGDSGHDGFPEIDIRIPDIKTTCCDKLHDLSLLAVISLERHSGKLSLSAAAAIAHALKHSVNYIERAVVLASGTKLTADLLPEAVTSPRAVQSRGHNEPAYILAALDRAAWNERETAEILGITRNALKRKMRQYRLESTGRSTRDSTISLRPALDDTHFVIMFIDDQKKNRDRFKKAAERLGIGRYTEQLLTRHGWRQGVAVSVECLSPSDLPKDIEQLSRRLERVRFFISDMDFTEDSQVWINGAELMAHVFEVRPEVQRCSMWITRYAGREKLQQYIADAQRRGS